MTTHPMRPPSLPDRVLGVVGVGHPVLFAVAYVLDRFATTNTAAVEVVRPLIVTSAAAALLTLLLWGLVRNRSWAALLASAVFLILVIHPIPAMVLTVLVAWWAGVTVLRRRGGRPVPALDASALPVRAASVYAVVLVVAGLLASASSVLAGVADPPRLPVTTSAAPGPNIYLLLLDGYARADTLVEEFGYDNGAFLSELERLGFTVADDARSNYNKTWLTMASMLNGTYVHDIPEIADPPATAPEQVRLAHSLINQAAALEHLRERGYEIVSIPSAVMSTDVTDDAAVWSDGHLNSFEIALISASVPAFVAPRPVLDFLTSDARGLVQDQLDAFADAAASASATPRIVLAHVMAPHPPFVLGQEPDYLGTCFPGCKLWEATVEETGMTFSEYAERVRTQLEALNELIVPALEDVVDADPEAVVIVMSDHGARQHREATDEHFRILFAARGEETLPEPEQAPVNVLRRILSDRFDEDLDDLPYRRIASNWHLPLSVERDD